MFKSFKRLVLVVALIGSLYACKVVWTTHDLWSLTPLQLVEKTNAPTNKLFKKTKAKNHVSAVYNDNFVSADDPVNKGPMRWKTNKVTVYIDPKQRSEYIEAYTNAINLWNSYGLFYFDLVDTKDDANVYLTHKKLDNKTTHEAEGYVTMGVTQATYYVDHHYMASATVYFNDKVITDKSQHYTQDKLNSVAAHELGHAIGLEHSKKNHTLMYWTTTDNFSDTIDDDTLSQVAKLYKDN